MVATDEEEDLARRRQKLELKLVEKGVLIDEETGSKVPTEKAAIGQAVKLASEFLAAVVVGVLLGLGFDQVTGFSPWGLVVFLFLGFAAGIMNMLRAVGYAKPHPADRRKGDKLAD